MKIVISGATSGFGVAWLRELDDTQQAELFVLARDRQKFDVLVAQHPQKMPTK
ncbi:MULTISPECIES: hypothetical protein [Pseudoalteromonas]|uniref:hypothetical protein n=1 Tax=Pseudoalteromonas TaxID=53246 RepID=UPI00147F8849|nr:MULTISPECIES: hypothetical protein [Pseudoalteromonas]